MDPELDKLVSSMVGAKRPMTEIISDLTSRGYDQTQINDVLAKYMGGSSTPSVDSPSKSLRAKFDLTKAFVLIGALLIVIATVIVVVSNWSNVGAFERIMFLLIPMLVLYGISAALNKNEKYREISESSFLVGSFILPLFIGTFLYQLKIVDTLNEDLFLVTSLVSIPFYVLYEALLKKHYYGLFTIIASFAAVGSLATKMELTFATTTWLLTILAGLFGLIGYGLSLAHKKSSEVYFFFGVLATSGLLLASTLASLNEVNPLSTEANSVLVAAFGFGYFAVASGLYYLYKTVGDKTIYTTKRVLEELAPVAIVSSIVSVGMNNMSFAFIGLLLSVVFIMLSTKVWINTFVLMGVIGIVSTVLSMTQELFGDSTSWPIVIFIVGFLLIGLGFLVRKLYKDKSSQNYMPILGLGEDSTEVEKKEQGHSSALRIFITIILVYWGLQAIISLIVSSMYRGY